MSLDENIYQLRRQKLQQIKALGQPAYPHGFNPTHQLPGILLAHAALTAEELESSRVDVRVAGRIMAIRLMGKAGFASSRAASGSRFT